MSTSEMQAVSVQTGRKLNRKKNPCKPILHILSHCVVERDCVWKNVDWEREREKCWSIKTHLFYSVGPSRSKIFSKAFFQLGCPCTNWYEIHRKEKPLLQTTWETMLEYRNTPIYIYIYMCVFRYSSVSLHTMLQRVFLSRPFAIRVILAGEFHTSLYRDSPNEKIR